MADTPDYAKTSARIDTARERRHLCETMRGGRAAMIKARETYLPRLGPLETEARYKARLILTPFANFLAEAVGFSVGQVFSKAPKWGADIPGDIVTMVENVDLCGNHGDLFLMDLFRDYWYTGLGLFLVDMPRPRIEGERRTIADEQSLGLRPYWVRYRADQVLGYRETIVRGRSVLSQLRLDLIEVLPDGEYLDKDERRVRVYWSPDGDIGLASFAEFALVKPESNEWAVVTDRSPIDINEIPVVTLGGLSAPPPLQDLADLNVQDFQLGSTLRNIEHVANVPIPTVTGVAPDTLKEALGAWAVDSICALQDPAATFGYWEHSGKCIDGLKASIATNREEMARRALRSMLESRPSGDVTATSDILNAGRTYSQLAEGTRKLQDAAENGLRLMAKWLKKGEDKGGQVQLNQRFSALPMKEQAREWLDWAVSKGLISKQTAFGEAQRYEALSDTIVWEDEQERIKAEEPDPMGEAGRQGAVMRRALALAKGGMSEDEAMAKAEAEMDGLDDAVEDAAA